MSKIALPTIYIYFVLLCLWIGAILLGTGYFGNEKAYNIFSLEKPESIKSVLLTAFTLGLCIFCCYGEFTVMHDAAHGSISSEPFINHLFGWLSQVFMGPLGDFNAFKYLHLTHHRFTNDLRFDPDTWASAHGPGGLLLMPLRWLSVDIAYIATYLPLVIPFYPGKTIESNKRSIVRNHPYIEMGIFWIYKLAMMSFIYKMTQLGYGSELMQYWVLPSMLAKTILAYAFDYLPHEPHRVKLEENPFHTTSYLSTPPKTTNIFSLLLFYQNYHIAHHLNPKTPFYEYKQQWLKHQVDWITNKKINIKRILPFLGQELLPVR